MRLQLTLAATVFLFAVGVRAATTTSLSDAEIQGRNLAYELCATRPAENFTNTGVLKIRDGKGKSSEVPIKFETVVTETNWSNIYQEFKGTNAAQYIFELTVIHIDANSNKYLVSFPDINADVSWGAIHSYTQMARMFIPPGANIMKPFAGSDFWIADLGLEFFHWPQQKILPHTTNLKRGRSYTLLESTNPNPTTNGYSRVLSWIDKESGGILEAEAYDIHGRLLKDFAPKSFKKVNGQWELQEMEIRNVQTGSRTRLEFDLKK